MRFDCAPMEGVTCAAFRRVHHQFYSGVDRYYIPFLAPSAGYCLKGRVLRELDAPSREALCAVPQILTKNAQDFLRLTQMLAELGFREVNLNCGCPSGTVTAKGKGAGFLADPDALDRFLEEVFRTTPLPVSVKTRLGMTDPAEFGRILQIYNRYPIAELIIHPRTRAEFYKGDVHTQAFEAALRDCKLPLCYNGNLFTSADCARTAQAYPQLRALMSGRGLAANPALAEQLHGGKPERSRLKAFYDALCAQYFDAYGSWAIVLPRMKELWYYLLHSFEDDGTYAKKLHKAATWQEFRAATDAVFDCAPMRTDALPFGGAT